MEQQLSDAQKKQLFWACFLSLMAAGVGFAYRVMVLGDWGTEFNLTGGEMGRIFGASLWPIAVMMILFSLVVDFVGYKRSMYLAFFFQATSAVLTCLAKSPTELYWAALCAGLGHGIIEAVINPVCATLYTTQKSKMLNILHASWPAGLVAGGTVMILCKDISWQLNALWILVPVLAYGIMFIKATFPVDERVAAKVPYSVMLKDVGFLSSSIAAFLLFYELTNVFTGTPPNVFVALGVGLAIGAVFGFITKSFGKPLYFILCLLMIPLATTELGTDAWIKQLMTPVMGEYAAWAIVLSAFIMMILRFQAGILTSRFSPPTILVISSFFSMMGLIALSQVDGWMVFAAFVLYAVGQTFYWPTVLGLASEQYPEGGALSLNTVSAIGLLSVGIIGGPIIGIFNDNHTTNNIKEVSTEVYEASKVEKEFFGASYEATDAKKATELAESVGKSDEVIAATTKAGRQSLMTVALAFPCVMMVCFGIIGFWYKSKGGYKPRVLEATWE
ncbi:MFS transporter [Rubritalea spongiae]|uniref:MFS transporter n=1 Tax=Rubritalea spongiae TaxID=430797 RepID=A0ABW5E5G9_9BACT